MGGGIYDTGTLLINGCIISGNGANEGAGIYSRAGTLAIHDSTLSDNRASDSRLASGGGIFNFGALMLSNCTLSGNAAGPGGSISGKCDTSEQHSRE